jgi:hypothetical protein
VGVGVYQDTNLTREGLPISLPQPLASVSPLVLAAALLVGRQVAVHLELPAATVEQILTATSASKSRAYELAGALAEALPTLARGRGRPAASPATAEPASDLAITRAVLDFVMRHPGCVDPGAVRQRYSDGFRRFIVEFRATRPDVALDAFAVAVQVPLATLKDWLRDPRSAAPAPEVAEAPAPNVEDAQMQTVVDAWTRWDGTFLEFCDHVRRELRIPFGRDLIRQVLDVHRVRKMARRAGRTPDERALRGAFRTFFPGAQWVGDGMQVPVVVDGTCFTVNLELDVDAFSGAFVGLSVRDAEDSTAVIEAFDSGVVSTGSPPLALLLDNRPSNHSPEVDAALGDTIRIRATTERPQNKAHVEGAFGLFSRILPTLVLDTTQPPQALAASLVRLVAVVWARASNHRPRNDRGGRSRLELYGESPSAEQIERALRDLRELKERQERARLTQEARCRPELLALLDDHFGRLGLLDPERHVRVAIARYPLSAIIDAIAIFGGKRAAGTLPDGADARYLLGITRNVAAETEGEAIARRLLELRIEARDRMLRPLIAARDTLRAMTDAQLVVRECVDRALSTASPLDRTFWLDTLADVLLAQCATARDGLFLAAVRRIEATFAIPPRDRHEAVRRVATRIRPLE